jgi:hypothetical protein
MQRFWLCGAATAVRLSAADRRLSAGGICYSIFLYKFRYIYIYISTLYKFMGCYIAYRGVHAVCVRTLPSHTARNTAWTPM